MAKACVCSHVLTTTASKSLCALSKSWRKSVNFAAFGCFFAAASVALLLTSHSATMFSADTPPRLAAPRPPAPMIAMFSFSFALRARRNRGAARAVAVTAEVFRNARREGEVRGMAWPGVRGRKARLSRRTRAIQGERLRRRERRGVSPPV